MARKVNKNLIALGSAAIVGVYALGYAHTQPAANQAAATLATVSTSSAAAAAQAVVTVPTPTAIAQAIATAAQPPAAARPQTVAGAGGPVASTNAVPAAATYRDGTYQGSGSSRRGDVSVAVTVQGGQISNVQITDYTTYYPISRIARLPGQVISRQSAQVDFVSGATESSRAFRQAVTNALSHASGSAAIPSIAPAAG